jgi:hypothetical protein
LYLDISVTIVQDSYVLIKPVNIEDLSCSSSICSP